MIKADYPIGYSH